MCWCWCPHPDERLNPRFQLELIHEASLRLCYPGAEVLVNLLMSYVGYFNDVYYHIIFNVCICWQYFFLQTNAVEQDGLAASRWGFFFFWGGGGDEEIWKKCLQLFTRLINPSLEIDCYQKSDIGMKILENKYNYFQHIFSHSKYSHRTYKDAVKCSDFHGNFCEKNFLRFSKKPPDLSSCRWS